MRVKSKILDLEYDIAAYESCLQSLEERGIYHGAEYDNVVEQLTEAEQDLKALQQLDEDDHY
jgi:hypothetical protein